MPVNGSVPSRNEKFEVGSTEVVLPRPLLAPVGSALPSGLRTTKLLPAGRVTLFTSIPRVLSPAVPLKVKLPVCPAATEITIVSPADKEFAPPVEAATVTFPLAPALATTSTP